MQIKQISSNDTSSQRSLAVSKRVYKGHLFGLQAMLICTNNMNEMKQKVLEQAMQIRSYWQVLKEAWQTLRIHLVNV